jgi:hypothetical protein
MNSESFDTLIVAASEESFDAYFMLGRRWFGVRVDSRKVPSLKWLAVYRGSPVSAITHYAAVNGVKEDPRTGRLIFDLDEARELIRPVGMSSSRPIPIQGQRYIRLELLLKANDIGDLLKK